MHLYCAVLIKTWLKRFSDKYSSNVTVVGLQEGDRVIEVNGVNVVHESHQEVFSRIKAINDHVSLLVVDSAAEQHFRQCDVRIDGQMTQVLRVTCPDVNPASAAVAVAIATASGIYVAMFGVLLKDIRFTVSAP